MTQFRTLIFKIQRRRYVLLSCLCFLLVFLIFSNHQISLDLVKTDFVKSPSFSFHSVFGYFNVFETVPEFEQKSHLKPIVLTRTAKDELRVSKTWISILTGIAYEYNRVIFHFSCMFS